ncbi:alpha/beta hydrolase [Streptomyces sp. NBC_01591]|uniref:alpha/beta hydrolase n=1 Tax=Streptomyces sp. NBC_01591 TaxID=2975888 RepID=UPI002DD99803|nr:alpha/beta hydrolase [Streptomyces sp. NBC_01591]WSD69425.1 alpha/beta hydrolase [Streptomyces sp. NBC_01591]
MTTYRKSAAFLALSVTAVATAITGAVTPPAHAEGAAPALSWRPCATAGGPAAQECAELPVPQDYRDPDGPQLSLAVTRVRSDRPAARRGTLMVIAGGPGSSGVQRVTEKGERLQRETGGRYDIVSLDPRGVGGSTKASCGLAPEDRELVNLRSWPGADGSITENVTRSRRTAEACARNGGPVLRSLTTANEVRDIDRFRQALGEEKLSAWGSSYGTYVGAVYAQKYPQHTDRWVLDSSGDPDPSRVGQGWLANMAVGADDRFPDFARWASDPARDEEGLRLAQRAEDVRPLVLDLAARLDREPRESTTPGVPLTGNRLRQALQMALYDDDAFAELAELVQAARDTSVTPVLPAALSGPLPDADAAVSIGVVCNDVRWQGTVASFRRAVAADRVQHPLTAGVPANVTPCAFWKDVPAEEPTRITDQGPSNVLMIQGLRDPATPYSGALKMRAAFGDRARMVAVDHGGHGMYLGNGNACGDRAVTEFLTTGTRPERDAYCAD